MAALYVQNFDDGVALAAVNEVESLTTGLSNKIWQKIMILYNIGDSADQSNGSRSAVSDQSDHGRRTDEAGSDS